MTVLLDSIPLTYARDMICECYWRRPSDDVVGTSGDVM